MFDPVLLIVIVYPPLSTVPARFIPLAVVVANVNVGAAVLNVILLFIVKSYPPTPAVPALLVIAVVPPLNVKLLPDKEKLELAPFAPINEIELNVVPAVKSL